MGALSKATMERHMRLTANRAASQEAPSHTTAAAAGGLIWNAFGLYQFARTSGASAEDLTGRGMSAVQADLYAGLPNWMDLAFGLGVVGGLAGSLALLMHMRAATPVLFVSLASYVVLFAGDLALGVFDAFGAPQIMVMSLVLLIASMLLWVSARASRLAIDDMALE